MVATELALSPPDTPLLDVPPRRRVFVNRNLRMDDHSAERVRKAVEKTEFEWEGKRIPVTVSIGVSTLHAGENVPDVMVRRADEALYRAKKTGKNRVCLETFAAV